jgi:hypothetical protein
MSDHDCSKHIAEVLREEPATPTMLASLGKVVNKIGFKAFVAQGKVTPAHIPTPTRRSMLKLAERGLFDALDAIAILGRLAQGDPTAVEHKDAVVAAAGERFIRILGVLGTIGASEATREARNEDTERPEDTDDDDSEES